MDDTNQPAPTSDQPQETTPDAEISPLTTEDAVEEPIVQQETAQPEPAIEALETIQETKKYIPEPTIESAVTAVSYQAQSVVDDIPMQPTQKSVVSQLNSYKTDAEFAQAKAFLQKTSPLTNLSVYDHLTACVASIIEQRPDNVIGNMLFQKLNERYVRDMVKRGQIGEDEGGYGSSTTGNSFSQGPKRCSWSGEGYCLTDPGK